MMDWSLFYRPVQWSSGSLLWLLLPLCAAVAIVYKTLRTRTLRRVPLEVLLLLAYMIAGIVLLAVGLWLVQEFSA